MAPKLGAVDVPVNDGPTVGINTSDRNGTQIDDALEAVSSNESDKGTNGKRTSANSDRSGFGSSSSGGLPTDTQHVGKRNGNGNGDAEGSTSSAGSQLKTDVGSLKLTAPGTSLNNTSYSSSEDGGSIDDTDRVEQQEKLSR